MREESRRKTPAYAGGETARLVAACDALNGNGGHHYQPSLTRAAGDIALALMTPIC